MARSREAGSVLPEGNAVPAEVELVDISCVKCLVISRQISGTVNIILPVDRFAFIILELLDANILSAECPGSISCIFINLLPDDSESSLAEVADRDVLNTSTGAAVVQIVEIKDMDILSLVEALACPDLSAHRKGVACSSLTDGGMLAGPCRVGVAVIIVLHCKALIEFLRSNNTIIA